VLLAAPAVEAAVPTGCCLREFTPSELTPTVFCTETSAVECFQFAGVGVVSESFEAGKVCAADGQSCVSPAPPGIDLDIGLGRPPAAPDLPGSILVYPSFDSGKPATIRARVINTSGSTLTHTTVRIFQGNDELLNDENVPFTASPGAGYLLDEDTILPERSEVVGVLVCYATDEMGPTDCPEYPTGVTGYGERSIVPRGPAPVQVFTAVAFGVLLQSGAIRPVPIADTLGLALLSAVLLGLGVARQRRRARR
jgi:hypothetical protein